MHVLHGPLERAMSIVVLRGKGDAMNTNRTAATALMIILCGAVSVTSADLRFTARIHREGQKDNRQYCGTDFVIATDGAWSATTQFSNGKKIDGDHFAAVMTLRDQGGKPLIVTKQVAGVDGSFGGRARERTVTSKGKVDPAVIGQIVERNTTYQCTSARNSVPDEQIVALVLRIIESF